MAFGKVLAVGFSVLSCVGIAMAGPVVDPGNSSPAIDPYNMPAKPAFTAPTTTTPVVVKQNRDTTGNKLATSPVKLDSKTSSTAPTPKVTTSKKTAKAKATTPKSSSKKLSKKTSHKKTAKNA